MNPFQSPGLFGVQDFFNKELKKQLTNMQFFIFLRKLFRVTPLTHDGTQWFM